MNKTTPDPWVSVVIPAHQEQAVIRRCLRTLLDGTRPGVDVVVAVNASTDATVERAKEVARTAEADGHRVTVLDISEAGKPGAVRAGWETARAYPRVLLDADVELDGAALEALVDAVGNKGARVASPTPHLLLDDSSRLVRRWATVWLALPYASEHLIGSGVLAVGRSAGRAVMEMPDVLNDDAWLRRTFPRADRALVPQTFVVRPPRTARALVARRARVHLGNAELSSVMGADQDGTGVDDLLRLRRDRTVGWLDLAGFLLITIASRVEVVRRRRTGRTRSWSTDTTSRQEAGT